MKVLPTIKNLIIRSQRVFLRADLNVPLEDGVIMDDYRLEQIIPTINYIQQHGGKVILATHLGRPNAHSRTNYFDKVYSTEPLAGWLEDHGYSVFHEPDLIAAQQHSITNTPSILLLENLRFFNGEQGTTQERYTFATLLASLADEYVNDAFGLIHKDDTSVTLLAEQFLPQNRSIGFLIEKELNHLNRLKHNPEQPFVLVLGGKKITDKIALLKNFITTQPPTRPASIIIGGLIATYFIQAQYPTLSLPNVDKEATHMATTILALANEHNVGIHIPEDFLIESADGNYTVVAIGHLPSSPTIVDIGPATVKSYTNIIQQAKSLFLNGTMGKYEDFNAQEGTKAIIASIAQANAYKVAGGGDAIASINTFGFSSSFDFLSTGGGASLAFLSSSSYSELPALKVI